MAIQVIKAAAGAVTSFCVAAETAGKATEVLAQAALHAAGYVNESAKAFEARARQERELAELEFSDDLAERRKRREDKLRLPAPGAAALLPNG